MTAIDRPASRRRRTLKIVAIVTGVLLVAVGVLAATFSPGWILTPWHDFDPSAAPPVPDYTAASAWAARPEVSDHADLTVAGESTQSADAPADAFYVHPTTYFRNARWNAPIDHPVSGEFLDEIVLAAEASALNGCCRVYAPRYRQATLGSYYASPNNALPAFELAYADVSEAFDAFLKQSGDRPFVLAGHSQGSMHLMRLLERIDDDEALRERLVVAYLPGFGLPRDQYGEVWHNLVPCESPEQLGCVAAWDTYREGARVGGTEPLWHWRDGEIVRIPVEAPRQCTNPVTWTDEGRATAAAHRGAVAPRPKGDAPSFINLLTASEPLGIEVTGLQPFPDVGVDAHCEDGVLRVPDLGALGFPEMETQPGNYHLHDYELFHADIRANASARVRAWLAASEG